jgi:hypothetical protein
MKSEISPALIMAGGVMWLIVATILIFGSIAAIIIGVYKDPGFWNFLAVLFLAIGILFLFFGILAMSFSKLMSSPYGAKKLSVLSLVLGVLGLNILVLIGGIIGILESKKK